MQSTQQVLFEEKESTDEWKRFTKAVGYYCRKLKLGYFIYDNKSVEIPGKQTMMIKTANQTF